MVKNVLVSWDFPFVNKCTLFIQFMLASYTKFKCLLSNDTHFMNGYIKPV